MPAAYTLRHSAVAKTTFALLVTLATAGLLLGQRARDTILLDFGGAPSAAPYNNVSDARVGDRDVLTNTDGELTGYGLAVTDAFNGVNTGGTAEPSAATGFIGTATGDSFFGNTAEFGGATEPTGAISLTGLNPELAYEITLFASRMNASDVRSAEYVAVGATRDSALLDASNNIGEVAVVTVAPAADSSLTILVRPGPDNDNGSGFYYLGAVRLTYDEQEGVTVVSTPADTLLIDFGTVLSASPWNNVTEARSDSVFALTDEEGRETAVTLEIVDQFNNVNTAGSQEPADSIGFPATATGDSFFGSVTDFGGATEPTGAIELAGLDPALAYTLRIFASRAASDNRQARYLLTGATVDSVFLDAASNDGRVAVATLRPDGEGRIRLEASTGPDNTNSAGFYYLGALELASDPTAAGLDSVLVDFGSPDRQSPRPANNVTDPNTGRVDDLTNARGLATGYAVAVADSFNNVNTAGTLTPDPALGLPPEATGDSFFGNVTPFGGQTQPTGAVRFSGLDTGLVYTVSVFGSRAASDNREARYVYTGATVDTVDLDAASNDDEVATARLRPAADGTIAITASPGPNNTNASGFYYLGAVLLTYPKQDATGPQTLTLVQPDGGELLQAGRDYDIAWASRNVDTVALAYSTDGGATFVPIDTVAAIDGAYAWTIPAVATDEALVRIASGTLADTSGATFAITLDTNRCTIVVIGSSTAEGVGASSPDSSWVGRFRENIAGDNTQYEVVNLARGGYTTFHLLPTGSALGAGVNIDPDTARNITAALRRDPFAIIVNLPSNDAARFFTVATQLRNFGLIDSTGTAGGARVYVTTTQPRNFSAEAQISNQLEVRDSILAQYGERAIDFFDVLAAPDGTIRDEVDSGDGIHVNDEGHRLLFEQVRARQLDTVSCTDPLTSVGEAIGPGPTDLRVYPNPVRGDRVYVDVSNFAAEEAVVISWMNSAGQVLAQAAPHSGSGGWLEVALPINGSTVGVIYARVTRVGDGRSAVVAVVRE